MTTLSKLTEQVRRLYSRAQKSRENIKPLAEDREIKLLVVQAAQEMLVIEPKQGAKMGDITIPSCMIATYTNQVVTGSAPYQTVLPAYPIHLPHDMGVWAVIGEDGEEYIPITSSTWSLLKSLDEGLLEDQVGYRVEGRKIIYTAAPDGPVTIKLLIIDPELLGDHDPFPIPPEYEGSIIGRVMEMLTGTPMKEEEKPKR